MKSKIITSTIVALILFTFIPFQTQSVELEKGVVFDPSGQTDVTYQTNKSFSVDSLTVQYDKVLFNDQSFSAHSILPVDVGFRNWTNQNKSWTATAEERTVFEIQNLPPLKSYLLYIDGNPEKYLSSTVNGNLNIEYSDWSTHTFTLESGGVVLNITSTEGGQILQPDDQVTTYDENTTVTIQAENFGGYRFVKWTGETKTVNDTSSKTTTINMTDDYNITAEFEPYLPIQRITHYLAYFIPFIMIILFVAIMMKWVSNDDENTKYN